MYGGRIVEKAPNEIFFSNPSHPSSVALLNSIPNENSSELKIIEGQPPTIDKIIPGCRFNPRCTNVIEICTNTVPDFKEISQNHFCACFNKSK